MILQIQWRCTFHGLVSWLCHRPCVLNFFHFAHLLRACAHACLPACHGWHCSITCSWYGLAQQSKHRGRFACPRTNNAHCPERSWPLQHILVTWPELVFCIHQGSKPLGKYLETNRNQFYSTNLLHFHIKISYCNYIHVDYLNYGWGRHLLKQNICCWHRCQPVVYYKSI